MLACKPANGTESLGNRLCLDWKPIEEVEEWREKGQKKRKKRSQEDGMPMTAWMFSPEWVQPNPNNQSSSLWSGERLSTVYYRKKNSSEVWAHNSLYTQYLYTNFTFNRQELVAASYPTRPKDDRTKGKTINRNLCCQHLTTDNYV